LGWGGLEDSAAAASSSAMALRRRGLMQKNQRRSPRPTNTTTPPAAPPAIAPMGTPDEEPELLIGDPEVPFDVAVEGGAIATMFSLEFATQLH
jgi:hypothetical protein